jgi:hypothetical protein
LTVTQCRELLGSEDAGLSDGQLEQMRDRMQVIANVLLDAYESFPKELSAQDLEMLNGPRIDFIGRYDLRDDESGEEED